MKLVNKYFFIAVIKLCIILFGVLIQYRFNDNSIIA